MNRLNLLSSLTGALALGAATATERSKLGVWIDEYTPRVTQAAKNILTPPFSPAELKAFADVVVVAANDLKGVFAGADRAQIAQIVFVEAARAALPDGIVEDMAVNILNSDVVRDLIESAYQRIFGAQADPAAKAAAEAALKPDAQAKTNDAALPGITRESGQPVEGADSPVNTPATGDAGEDTGQGAAAPSGDA